MRSRRIWLLLVVLVVVAIGYLLFFRKKADIARAEDSPSSVPAASVAPVTKGSIASLLRVAGQFIPYQEVDLHAKVSGYIRTITVDIGDRVRMGHLTSLSREQTITNRRNFIYSGCRSGIFLASHASTRSSGR